MIHPQNRLFLSDERKQTTVISNNVNESQMHYAKAKKSDTKSYIPYDSIDILEKATLEEQKSDQWLPGTGGWGREWNTEGHEGTSENKGNIYLDGSGVYRIDSMFVKTHQTIHLKKVNFTECKFYLNK